MMEKDDGNAMAEDKNSEGEGTMGDENAAGEEGAMMEKSSYAPFTKAAYDKARSEGKVVFLEFYANWCPYCAEQKPVNEAAFAGPQMPKGVAGFQVNYKDSDTDADEQALAREFGISYQHTRVVLKADGSVSHKSTGAVSQEQIVALAAAAGA